jgi:predicted AAA+ superfamily ATPase
MKTFEDEDVIYVLRGPRRIGKTTLIKLKIKSLLQQGVIPQNIFFYPCDLLDTPRQLADVIDTYLSQQRSEEGRAYLFIDEVSSLRDWQKAIKNLYDADRFDGCTLLLTGSHSIDLKGASESLAGRRGHVERLTYKTPDKVLLPAKFSEYVETIDDKLKAVIEELQLFRSKKRLEMFSSLADGNIPPEVDQLKIYTKDLNQLLERYLITGGVAQAAHQYISSRKIEQDTYDMFIGNMVRDLTRWRHRETYARQVLRAIIESTRSPTNWNALKDWTDIADSRTVEDYAVTLEDSYVVGLFYHLGEKRGMPQYRKQKKIYIQDPFIFHACRGWIFGKNSFELSLEYLRSRENRSALIEGVVGNHLSRLMFIAHPDPHFTPSSSVFFWTNGNRREVDFIIRLNDKCMPIEVKYSDSISSDDATPMFDFFNAAPQVHKSGIITSIKVLEPRRRYTIIPLCILLLLI